MKEATQATPSAALPVSTGAATASTSGDAGSLALAVFHEVLLALAHGSPREAVLQILTDKARLLAGCASAAVVLVESDRDSVTFAAVSGEDARELQGTRVRAGDTFVGNTARTGEPYLAFSPAAAPSGDNGTISSAAVVPIFEGGVPVGAIAALNKRDGRPFAGDDLLSLSTLAAAASIALSSERLRADSQRQSRELSTLYEAVRNVSGQLGAQEVLTAVMEQVAAHIEGNAVAVFLVNDERTHLYIAADQGLQDDQREVTLPTDLGLGAAVFAATRPLFLSLGYEDDLLPASPPALEPPFPGLPARSALAAPIRSGETIHGLIYAQSGQPDAYTLTDANLLGALAAQAAVAMENAWLYEDANRRAEEAAALYELSQTITGTLRLPDILELVADSVLNLLAVDKFALFLREPRTERLQMVVARGLPEGAAERVQPAPGQGVPGWVLEFETPTAVQDVAADHRNASAPLHEEGVVSMTCMPLQVGASTIGVLCAMSSRRRLFTVAEMELLYTIANQAAIAIENARIYADVRQKSRELRKYFHRVARALGSSQSPEGVPQLIASLTLEVMGADRCALYSLDENKATLKIEAATNFRVPDPSALSNPEESPAIWVARRARPLAIEDLSDDNRFAAWAGRTLRGRIGSYLGVPLRIGRQVVGVLETYTRAPRLWRGDEVRLLLTFASQATVAFQNARLAKESGRAARDADLLRRLLEMATAGDAPGAEALARVLAESFEAPVVVLTGDASGTWGVRAAHGLPARELASLTPPLVAAASGQTPPSGFVLAVDPAGKQVALALQTEVIPADDIDDTKALLLAAAPLLARERATAKKRL